MTQKAKDTQRLAFYRHVCQSNPHKFGTFPYLPVTMKRVFWGEGGHHGFNVYNNIRLTIVQNQVINSLSLLLRYWIPFLPFFFSTALGRICIVTGRMLDSIGKENIIRLHCYFVRQSPLSSSGRRIGTKIPKFSDTRHP